ncbi:uncharacterized protein LOC126768339 [Nymphalis io]|uniref:uncharacterized protein LOC126768339 n=1 Tax=Inachis io TaxID=171585 RepID=UPI002168AE11|nr:uncharacterized protein LOC126768339 [Nymphalis io]
MGTAEIEAILNEIKHRELQMIAQQEPSVSELISSTVTETTFLAVSHPKSRISTILSLDKDNKVIIESTTLNNVAIDEKQQHNINHRSLKHDATTLAYNVENEVKKTKATVKEKINKMCTKATARTKAVAKSSKKVHRNITRMSQTRKPIVKTTVRKLLYSRKLNKNKFTTTLHSIPVLNDDYSMLSVFELLLTKTHENNMMNILSTKNFPIKREIKSKELIENTNNDKTKYEEFDSANIDYNYNSATPSEQNVQSENIPEDTSFESLSNKISYNDYVNGFKYYLNFQKDADDQRFSNLIRYQAHKHHKVDDIGKFILNKIPQLPTTRLKRKFVETETLDDQDVSTKSEDSWFKKHFFIFLDKDTPKKFHSVQTVSFKDSITKLCNKITKFNNSKSITTDSYKTNNHVTTPMTPLISKKYTTKKKEGLKKENPGFTNINMEDFKKRYKRKNIGKWNFNKKLRPKRNLDCAKGVEDLKSTLSMKSIGYVDINSVQKKTGHINTPPEQYFKTPIPMDVDDFNKFLKEENIDVLSVTSPLRDSVSKIVESRKSSSKLVPKLSSSQILEQNILKDLKTSTYNVKKKHGKRDLGERKYFTAKDVAALEVIVDLMKNTQGFVENEKNKEYTRSNKNNSYTTFLDKENQLNSIQIHIAIPPGVTDRKRSLESVNVRKVFSAIMSTPVDLEYQILTYDETTIAPTTVKQNILSPGLYLLVENTNSTCPKGNFALKPLSSIETSNFNIRHATSTVLEKSETIDTMSNTDSFSLKSKETENDHSFTTNDEIKYKRSVNMAQTNKNFITRSFAEKNKKRHIDLNAVKRFFGHDRVCHCSCKVNKSMCKSCAESDKVISELIFEFDNLEKYVVDHCTEIQTFFWMNPAGGKKLRSVILRIDKRLNDYYKRVKGKCQGRTCQMISSNIDKRYLRVNELDHQLLNRLNALFDNLQNIPKCHMGF